MGKKCYRPSTSIFFDPNRKAVEEQLRSMPKLGSSASKKEYRDAVKEFCISCMGGRKENGYREAICLCSATKCPLYNLRPYKLDVRE